MSEALDTSLRLFREIRSSLLEATLSPDLRTALIAHIEESVHRSRALTYRDMFKIAGEDRSQVQAGSLEATAETLRILAEARENEDEPELPRKWLSSAWAALTYEGGQSPACAKLLSRETSQAWEQAETAQSEAEGPVEALETKALECLLALLCQDLRVAHSSARRLLERVTSVEEEVVQSFVEGDYTRADLEHFAGQTLLLRGIAAVSARLLMLDEQSAIPYSTYFDDAANIYRHLGSSVHWLLSRLLGTAMAEVARASIVDNLRDLFEDGREMEYLHSLLSTDRKIFQLWPSQLEAVRQGVFDAGLDRAAVSMPTSAGKTLIAEGLIARELLRDPEARCAYLAPTRALVSEVERKLKRSLRPLGIGVGQISAASELSPIETEIALENRLLCLTPEKLDVFLRLEHEILDSVRLIIVDEGQLLEEEERGQLLELAIVKLQLRFPATRIVFLSAVIPNTDEIAAWLGAGELEARSIRSHWRPTKLRVGGASIERVNPEELETDPALQAASGEGRRIIKRCKIEYVDGDEISAFFIRYGEAGQYSAIWDTDIALAKAFRRRGNVLVLTTSKPRAETIAGMLVDEEVPRDDPELDSLAQKIRREIDPDFELAHRVERGVAYHHGDLPPRIRYEVETAARQGRLDFVVATTTLAEGVNLPISTLIVDDLNFRYQRDGRWRTRRMSAREFWNLAGRAGRALVDAEGHVIIVEPERFFETPEDKGTFLSPDVSTLQPVESVFLQLIKVLEGHRPGWLSFDYDADRFRGYTPVQNFLLALLDLEHMLGADGDLESAVEKVARHSLITYQEETSESQRTHFADFVRWGFGVVRRYEDLPEERKRLIVRLGVSIQSAVDLIERLEGMPTEELTSFIQIREDGELAREQLESLYSEVFSIPEIEPQRYEQYRHEAIAVDWVRGATVGDVASDYFAEEDRALSRACNYLYSTQALNAAWGVNGLVAVVGSVLAERGEVEDPDLPEHEVSLLSAYSAYGVPTQVAAFFAAHGVERLDSVILGNWFYSDQGVAREDLVSSSTCIEWLRSRPSSQIREHILDHRGSFDSDLFSVIEQLERQAQ